MTNITGKLKAWLPEYSSLRPDQIDTPEAIEQMVFTKHDMRDSGWTYVGEAIIAIDVILSPEQLIASKIETLREKQKKIRAEAEEHSRQIEGLIQNLLAITYTPEAA